MIRDPLRKLWRGLAAVLLLASTLTAACAQDLLPVPAPTARVIDQTRTLDAAQRSALTDKLAALEQTTGSQLAVLIVPTTQPEDIASYAQRVADQWKIGRRKVGDGLLIVVARNDRKVRIEVAKALEGAIPDVLAGRVVREQITPAFKADDYAGGLNAAVDRLAGLVRGEGLPAPEPADADAGALRGDAAPGIQWQELAMFFFVGVPLLGTLLTGLFGRKLGSLVTGGAAGGLSWWLTASALLAGAAGLLALLLVGVFGIGAAAARGAGRGRSSGGLGVPIIFGSGGFGGFGGFGGGGGGGGGGGFQSGGGGDFGGGGASGDW